MTEREDNLTERKARAEAEFEAYAQAGVVSPGLLKSARWVSRALYLGMGVLVVILLWRIRNSVSEESYENAVADLKATREEKQKLEEEKEGLEGLLSETLAAAADSRRLLEDRVRGRTAADRAQDRTRLLIQRFRGEMAYTLHWREQLRRAEPEAHGDDPRAGAKSVMEQAASAPAAQSFELLRELADFGEVAVRDAAAELLLDADRDADGAKRKTAALVLARVGGDESRTALRERALAETDQQVLREIWFALSVLGAIFDGDGHDEGDAAGAGPPIAEACLPAVMTGREGLTKALEQRVLGAESALELLALLAEAADMGHAGFFRGVATAGTKSDAERIVAIRWMAARGDPGFAPVLKGLSTQGGAVGEEALAALARLGAEGG